MLPRSGREGQQRHRGRAIVVIAAFRVILLMGAGTRAGVAFPAVLATFQKPSSVAARARVGCELIRRSAH